MATFTDLFDQAERYHRLGNTREAERLYREIIGADPSLADAHVNLGNILFGQRLLDEAAACYRHALLVNADYADAHYNLGNTLFEQGHFCGAAECYRQALRLDSRQARVHNNLGLALVRQGLLAEAAKSYREAVGLNPDLANAHFNLGNLLLLQEQLAEAAECFRHALRINPNHADAHNNLGNVLFEQGQFADAAGCYWQALHLNPAHVDAHNNLGNVFLENGQLAEAETCYRQVLRLKPDYAQAYNNLGNVLKDQGNLVEALECYQQARNLEPEKLAWHSNLLYTLLYHPGYEAGALLAESRHWALEHAPAPVYSSFDNHPCPDRRVRIGYISSDFREHPIGRNIWPLLRRHDHKRFEIILYAHLIKADALTQQLRQCADHWRDIAGWPDDQAADKIRQERIDILVDLNLHMAGSRLLIFARKPAPVQVTFAGYPGSTGLAAIDYRLTDPYLDPPGQFDNCYVESTYRLPHSFWCYEPQSEEPAVTPLPALKNRFITFGCLNNFCKVNAEVLLLWARVLRAVAGSRLLLLAHQGGHRQRTLAFLARHGIAAERVEFCSPRPLPEYLALYHRVDIGLDTFPYNGHTTSLDSFWMGVPLITLVGNTVVGRAGLSQLTNLGLTEMAATSLEDFVRLAVDLAGDLPRLDALRTGLRERLRQSPLMDGAGFTQGIEQAYRDIWRKWCRQVQVL